MAQAESHWQGNVGRVTVNNPGDAGATVTLTRNAADGVSYGRLSPYMRFDGVTGQMQENLDELSPTVRTAGVITGLHLGLFAAPVLRWFYFLVSLAGTGMVGTGLVLWIAKRRQKARPGAREAFSLRLVDGLNAGTVAGLFIAVAAFFWANRLLPPDLPGRQLWEVRAFLGLGPVAGLRFPVPTPQMAGPAGRRRRVAGAGAGDQCVDHPAPSGGLAAGRRLGDGRIRPDLPGRCVAAGLDGPQGGPRPQGASRPSGGPARAVPNLPQPLENRGATMTLAAFCLAYAGFSALCLGMDRHYEDVFDRELPRRHRLSLRLFGWIALALSLWASAEVWGWSYGTVEWIGILSIAGLLLIWFLTFRPRAALTAGGLCALAAPVLAVV